MSGRRRSRVLFLRCGQRGLDEEIPLPLTVLGSDRPFLECGNGKLIVRQYFTFGIQDRLGRPAARPSDVDRMNLGL